DPPEVELRIASISAKPERTVRILSEARLRYEQHRSGGCGPPPPRFTNCIGQGGCLGSAATYRRGVCVSLQVWRCRSTTRNERPDLGSIGPTNGRSCGPLVEEL